MSKVKRLVERDGCSLELAQSKVAAQMPLEVKQKKSQYIIDNSSIRQETEKQVRCPSCRPCLVSSGMRSIDTGLESIQVAVAGMQCWTRHWATVQVIDVVSRLKKRLWWKSTLQIPINIAVVVIFAFNALV